MPYRSQAAFQILMSLMCCLCHQKNIKNVHEEYELTAKEMQFRSVGVRKFQRKWHELCPFLTLL